MFDDHEPARVEPVGPSRRAVIGGGVAAGALGWVAPTVLSVPAASAASVPPIVVIDPFTFPATVVGSAGSTMVIDPIGAVTVTREISGVMPATVTVGNGLATYTGGPGGVMVSSYVFGSPLDLSGCTALTASAALIVGTLTYRLFIDFVGGSSFIVDPSTTYPELRFDLAAFTPLQLGAVTSLSLRVAFDLPSGAEIGPLTAS